MLARKREFFNRRTIYVISSSRRLRSIPKCIRIYLNCSFLIQVRNEFKIQSYRAHYINRSELTLIANFRITVFHAFCIEADRSWCPTSSNDTCAKTIICHCQSTKSQTDVNSLMGKHVPSCRSFVMCANRFALSACCVRVYVWAALSVLFFFFSIFHHFQFAISSFVRCSCFYFAFFAIDLKLVQWLWRLSFKLNRGQPIYVLRILTRADANVYAATRIIMTDVDCDYYSIYRMQYELMSS